MFNKQKQKTKQKKMERNEVKGNVDYFFNTFYAGDSHHESESCGNSVYCGYGIEVELQGI